MKRLVVPMLAAALLGSSFAPAAAMCEMKYMVVTLFVKSAEDGAKLEAWAKQNNLTITPSADQTSYKMSGQLPPDEAEAIVKTGNKKKTFNGVALPTDVNIRNWSASGPCK